MTYPTTPPLMTDEKIKAFWVNGAVGLFEFARAIESAVSTPLLEQLVRERQSRLAAQVRVEQLHAEVARLEPMRQRAADIARLTRERDEARAELAAAKAQWQPIETAPKDGAAILVSEGRFCNAVEWNDEFDWWAVDDNKLGPFRLRGAAPTHWMPLPPHRTPPERSPAMADTKTLREALFQLVSAIESGRPDLISKHMARSRAALAAQAHAEPADYVHGDWFMANTVDQMQAFYRSRLPSIREAARECGYAVGVHGSERRDFDLIAVPWRDGASSADELAHAVADAACGITRKGRYDWEQKPAGRIATSIPICWASKWADQMDGVGHIDLSVMTVEPQLAAQAQANRCPHCDDTGDVHDQTGEWRGACTCPDGKAQAEPVAWAWINPSGNIEHFDGKPYLIAGPSGDETHDTPLFPGYAPQPAAQPVAWHVRMIGCDGSADWVELGSERPADVVGAELLPMVYADKHTAVDVEHLIAECIPGGTVCDPQQIADNIRRYFNAWPQDEPGELFNGLAEDETLQTASVAGLVHQAAGAPTFEAVPIEGCAPPVIAGMMPDQVAAPSAVLTHDQVRESALDVLAQDSGNSYHVNAVEELCRRLGVTL